MLEPQDRECIQNAKGTGGIIKIHVSLSALMCRELLHHLIQFCIAIFGIKKSRLAMQSHISCRGSRDDLVRQARVAYAAKNQLVLAKCVKNLIDPPAGMAKFDRVAEASIYAGDNQCQAFRTVLKAGRQLKQHTGELVFQTCFAGGVEFGKLRFTARHFFGVGNDFGRLDRISEPVRTFSIPALE